MQARPTRAGRVAAARVALLGLLLSRCTLGKECAPGCTRLGNCNQDEGVCECRYGWRGPTCDEALLPACHSSAEDRNVTAVGRAWPRSCECYKQMYAHYGCGHDKFRTCEHNALLAVDVACYVWEGVPASQQWTRLPAVGNNVSWHMFHGPDRNLTDLPAEKRFKFISPWDMEVALPLSACPRNCSDNGFCVMAPKGSKHIPEGKPPRCLCHKGWHDGADGPCSAMDFSLCPNSCLGRGQCYQGFCHCKPPYWGHDCGRSEPAQRNLDAIPPRTRLSIYVYDLPHWLSGLLPMDDGFHDRLVAHLAYETFTALLLSDTVHRTLDPWAANLFFVPAHVYSYSSNTGNPGPHLETVLQYVNQTWPWFRRYGGRDHFVWVPGDRGACYVNGTAEHMIKVTHFGYHLNRLEHAPAPHHLDPLPFSSVHGCYHPLRDVVVPPLYRGGGPQHVKQVYDNVEAKHGQAPERNLLFFFAGSVREGRLGYSGGARQAIFKALSELQAQGHNLSDVLFVQGRIDNYNELHQRSHFCICPHGGGFGMRFVIAMHSGCIPVITSDLVLQPFEAYLPFHEFTLRVPNSQLHDLVRILRSVTDDERARLRLGMAKWHHAFMWSRQEDGQLPAYNLTLTALHKNLAHFWGGLYRQKRQRRAAAARL